MPRTPTLRALAAILLAVAPSLWAQKPAEPAEILAWPQPPAPARIVWVSELRNEYDVGAKKKRSFIDRLAGRSEDVMRLARPASVAVDEKGTLYIGDLGQGIFAVDPAAKRMWNFTAASGRSLLTPTGLAVDSRLLFATDSATNSLICFDKQGRQLGILSGPDGVKRPVGVAVDEARDLVVLVNGGDHTVWLLNRSLKVLKKVGQRGDKEGQFNFPTYCCIVPGVGFAITDSANFRIQMFDFNGKFLRAFGKAGDQSGQFSRPKGVAVDADGQMYVVDAAFGNFQVFRQDGQLLTFVGQGGAGRGMFQIPGGIAIGKDGAIYVADQLNARIQKFQYLGAAAAGAPSTPGKG